MATLGSASCDLDIQLEKFITMLYTCESTVYLDTILTRKQTLKKYLISATVPITTIVKALGFVEHQPLDTQGPIVEETCQKLLEDIRIKIEYLKYRKKNIKVTQILHRLVVDKIMPKLEQYIHVSDIHFLLDDSL